MTSSAKRPFKKSVSPKQRPAPFSIRLSADERTRLEQEAGNRPLGTYIRAKLLGDDQSPRKPALRRQRMDYELLGRVLAALGQSELATCLTLLAVQAEQGNLPVADEVTKDLKLACEAVQDIRLALITGLGLKAGKKP